MTEVAISETKQLLIQDTLEQITGQVLSYIFCLLFDS